MELVLWADKERTGETRRGRGGEREFGFQFEMNFLEFFDKL